MESYYTMELCLTGTTFECIENLKYRLQVDCDSLESRIKRSKPELTLKLGEKDLKDLEFQLKNYKQYVSKLLFNVRPSDSMRSNTGRSGKNVTDFEP